MGKPLVRSQSRPPERIEALNEILKGLANRYSAVYLDYYTAMNDGQGLLRSELSDDGVHPNRQGYSVMARLAERAIATALAREA
ncbi:GDSL-type esterase/lipase family protein [Nitrospira sp. Nam80]